MSLVEEGVRRGRLSIIYIHFVVTLIIYCSSYNLLRFAQVVMRLRVNSTQLNSEIDQHFNRGMQSDRTWQHLDGFSQLQSCGVLSDSAISTTRCKVRQIHSVIVNVDTDG